MGYVEVVVIVFGFYIDDVEVFGCVNLVFEFVRFGCVGFVVEFVGIFGWFDVVGWFVVV